VTRLPYRFDLSSFESEDDDPWTKLDTINEYLEAGEPIPPYLAQWLGLAIRFAERDPNELLKRLNLKRGRGRVAHKHDANAWAKWGDAVCRRERDGSEPEAALSAVLAEYAQCNGEEVSRSQLQKWRDQYREAERVALCR
jgi:hypothetical protein